MTTGRITNRSVEEIRPGARDKFLWDSELSGFGVRVTQRGARSYVYQFRMGGRGTKTRRFTIGSHGAPWDAKTARARAAKLAQSVKRGRDPVAREKERRRREVELRFDRYVEFFTDGYLKHRWKDWQRVHDMLIMHAEPVLKDKKLSEITRADLSAIYHRLDNLPSVARSMHATLRKMFRWAMSRDDLKRSPVDGMEPPPPLRARTRYLSSKELAAAWAGTDALPAPYSTLFRLLILTGQRRGEVNGLRWSELDRERAEWLLPAERSKNGYAHVVALSKPALKELDRLAGGKAWPDTGLVLPSHRGTPLSAFSKLKTQWDKAMAKQLKASGASSVVTPWRLHDLRRTVATGMQALDVRSEVIEAVLNHVSGYRAGIVGVYQQHDFLAQKRKALSAWAKHVTKLRL